MENLIKYTHVYEVCDTWVDDNFDKVLELVKKDRTPLVAFDEAHLYHYWQEFKPAYKELKILKDRLSGISLLALTAPATPLVKLSILDQLREPHINKCSVNQPNAYLACKELLPDDEFKYFATCVLETLVTNVNYIIDFINKITSDH